jgi:hypothetical protein
MRIVRGPHTGATGRVMQYANDWVTVRLDSGERTQPMAPTCIRLTTVDEVAAFKQHKLEHVGYFWEMWEMLPSGMFMRRTQSIGERRGLNPYRTGVRGRR